MSILREEFNSIKIIHDGLTLSEALNKLVPHLTSEQACEALATANGISNKLLRSQVLITLAPCLPSEQINRVIDAIKTVDEQHFSLSVALSSLAPHLLPEQLDEALALAEIANAPDRSRAVTALAPYLAPDRRDEVLGHALAAAMESSAGPSAAALTTLAPFLAPEQREVALNDALVAARAISEDSIRISALASLIPLLTAQRKDEVLREAFVIGMNLVVTQPCSPSPLNDLARYLDTKQVSEALSLAKTIANDFGRSEVLVTLAPHLTPEQLTVALDAANEIGDEYGRSEAQAALVSCFTTERLGEAIEVAAAISNADLRGKALAALVDRLPAALKSTALLSLIDTVGSVKRSEALSLVRSGAGATFAVGGEEAILDLYNAIKDVSGWYP